MKKRYSLILVLSIAALIAFSQKQTINVKGSVINLVSGTPVTGQAVTIKIDSLDGIGYKKLVFTDGNGVYQDVISFQTTSSISRIEAYTADCNGLMMRETGYYNSTLPAVIIDFKICKTDFQDCNASFEYYTQPTSDRAIIFKDRSTGMANGNQKTYGWDFGDGNYSSQQNPVHSYSKQGLYNVCLYLSSNDSSCKSKVCLPVEVGNYGSGKCENYFWYQNDTSGLNYTFEGTLINGKSISMKWNFGDGSIAIGQKVTHSFANFNNKYIVTLTTAALNPDSSICTATSSQEIFVQITQPCESYFSYQPDSSGKGFIFQSWAQSQLIDSCSWNFGDGTTGIGSTVSHVFLGNEPSFKVCLTTTGINADGTICSSEYCQDVFIAVPSHCKNEFSFQPDSIGTGYIFTGKASGRNVKSWKWDFGDGTTNLGQQVSHTFVGEAMTYNVCLTTTSSETDSIVCLATSCQQVYINTPSTCNNYFKYNTIDNSTYTFSGTLNNGGQEAKYYWYFGDGENATGQQVTHTFSANKTESYYNVCLTTITGDITANNECKSISCQTIYTSTDSGCYAEMVALPDSSGNTFKFQNLTKGKPAFVSWDFGDGTQSNETNPLHTYVKPGIYTACLSISDSINNCSDRTCQEIWVNIIDNNCKASFYAIPADSSTKNTYLFFNTSVSSISGEQIWSFGDGTVSIESNPKHTYSKPGVYNVCLKTGNQASGCSDTYCIDLLVGKQTENNLISGIVLAGNDLAKEGIVWLIGADNTYYTQTKLDSAGGYYFKEVPSGSYYIYAMLTPGSGEFFKYMPTYYSNSMNWQNATIVKTGEPGPWYVVNLIQSWYMLNGTGTAVISGNIYWDGLTKAPLNTPAANVEIVLLNSDGTPIAYTFTNNEGYFEFEKLIYGDYTIHAEMPGKATEIAVVNLSENASNAGINFVMNKEAITITGISKSENSKMVAGNPYPNPVFENLNIDYNSAKSQTAEVEITDMQGRIIKTKTIGLRESKNSIRIATGDLVKGMYLIRIKTPGLETVTRKFVK